MSNVGLSVSDVVGVAVTLAPTAAQTRSFGSLLIAGDSDVIDVQSRIRKYTNIVPMGLDFGTSSPEYQAGLAFFGATPQPTECYVGRWARTATSGTLVGSTLGATAQTLSNFANVANGGMNITVDGVAHALSGVSLAGVSTLNGAASAVQIALGGAATVIWDANNARFVVKSATTGTGSTVSFANTNTGTDLSLLFGLSASSSGSYNVNGIAAETALQCAQNLAATSNAWYGLTFSASVQPSDLDYEAVSAFIQAASPAHIFGITTSEAAVLVPGNSGDVISLLSANRTFTQYSSSSPVAAAAAFGDAFTTNFSGQNTLYTLMYKQESGIQPETLTESQAAELAASFGNVYVNYNNGVAILQNGTMSDGTYFDIIHGTDWLQNALQTAIFNLLLTSRKIPQTDSGVSQIVAVICNIMDQAVANGLVAPGVWTGPTIGAIVTGQTLVNGYYVYAPPVSTQSQAARAARQAPVITIALKLAGAIHTANVLVNVNQ